MVTSCSTPKFSNFYTAQNDDDLHYVSIVLSHDLNDSKTLKGGFHFIEHLILTPSRQDDFHQLIKKSGGHFNGLTAPGSINLFYSIDKAHLDQSISLLYQRIQSLDLSNEVLEYEAKRFELEVGDEKSASLLANEKLFAYFENELKHYSVGSKGIIGNTDYEPLKEKLSLLHKSLLSKANIALYVAGTDAKTLKPNLIKKKPISGKPFLNDSISLPKEHGIEGYNTKYISIKSQCKPSIGFIEFLNLGILAHPPKNPILEVFC